MCPVASCNAPNAPDTSEKRKCYVVAGPATFTPLSMKSPFICFMPSKELLSNLQEEEEQQVGDDHLETGSAKSGSLKHEVQVSNVLIVITQPTFLTDIWLRDLF